MLTEESGREESAGFDQIVFGTFLQVPLAVMGLTQPTGRFEREDVGAFKWYREGIGRWWIIFSAVLFGMSYSRPNEYKIEELRIMI
jgi:hypothetical protein